MSEAWLRREYVELGRDCVQIGAELRRDPKTIWAWMKHYGIPTRPRGFGWEKRLPRGREPGFKLTDEQRDMVRQARLRDRRVPYLRDGKHWLKTVPRERHPNWKGGLTPERQAVYGTKGWRQVVAAVKKRDERRCQRCLASMSRGVPFDVHHIVSFEFAPLRCVLSNLVLLCEACHYWVHSKKNVRKEWIKPCPSTNS